LAVGGGQIVQASYVNPNPAYAYNSNQVVGQPSNVPPSNANYGYSAYQPKTSEYRNTGANYTVNPQVAPAPINDTIERPQVSQTGTIPTKKLGPDNDPKSDAPLCSPVWWILGALIGLALLTLALLFGLGVIGGHSNSSASPVATTGGSIGTSTSTLPSVSTTTAGASGKT